MVQAQRNATKAMQILHSPRLLLLRVTIGGAILQFYLDKVCLDGAPGVSLKEFLQDIGLLTIKLLKGIKKKILLPSHFPKSFIVLSSP